MLKTVKNGSGILVDRPDPIKARQITKFPRNVNGAIDILEVDLRKQGLMVCNIFHASWLTSHANIRLRIKQFLQP